MNDVPVIPRKKFVHDFGKSYQPGQHLTALGPSGRGKTRLGGQLLCVVASPKMEATVLHGKIRGRDKTIEELSRKGKFPITESSSLSRIEKLRNRDRRGWIVRPLKNPGESVESENALLREQFSQAIHENYHTSHDKPRITVADETHQLHNDLGLRKQCEGPLMRGRPDNAMWSFVQRGRHVSYMVYDQAEHVFIFYDPDEDNQKRYAEIGGVDKNLLIDVSKNLQTKTVADGSTISQCLYFRRSGDLLCIVDT